MGQRCFGLLTLITRLLIRWIDGMIQNCSEGHIWILSAKHCRLTCLKYATVGFLVLSFFQRPSASIVMNTGSLFVLVLCIAKNK